MKRIVVIDDEMTMDIFCNSFRLRGYEVTHITSADEALANMSTIASSDLVVLDIIMQWPDSVKPGPLSGPLSAGMQVLLELRKQNAELPIIVYSATQDAAVIEGLTQQKNVRFMSKWETSPHFSYAIDKRALLRHN